MLKMALLGLPVGLLLGYSLQRGGFCMNSAFRQIAFERDSRLFKAYGIALLIQMAVLLLLGGVLEIDPAAPPVWLLSADAGDSQGVSHCPTPRVRRLAPSRCQIRRDRWPGRRAGVRRCWVLPWRESRQSSNR